MRRGVFYRVPRIYYRVPRIYYMLLSVFYLMVVAGCNNGSRKEHRLSIIREIDSTTLIIDVGLDPDVIVRAYRHHTMEWIRNNTSWHAPTTVVVRNLPILPDGIHAGLAYPSEGRIETIAFHDNYPGIPLPYIYHEFGHLETGKTDHADVRWPRWENEQVASNGAIIGDG